MRGILEKVFNLSQNHTDIKKETLAGLTTFLTMSYIIFVQPAVLSKDFAGNPTGLDFGAVLLATCLVSAATTIFMGLFANYPIALAPGMGENFFFVSVVMALSALGIPEAWRVALGVIFLSGVAFFILSILRIREVIINSVSRSMRNGIAVGIGLFITFIGFRHGHLIMAKPATIVGINTDFFSKELAVFLFGLFTTGMLYARQKKGSILYGILASTVLALILGEIKFKGFLGLPQIHHTAVFQMNIKGALTLICLPYILVFLFMDMFDTVGTLIGVAETAGFLKDNKLPRASRVLVVDAVGTVAGACMGTSTITSYIESATGVAFGGRTGLTSVTVGFLFIVALFFDPLIGMIGNYPPITAPALVFVGIMMIQNVRKIDWDDFSESIPAFLTMVGIPFCYSIGDGLALGFVSYPIIKLISGKGKNISGVMYILAVFLLAYFLFIRTNLG